MAANPFDQFDASAPVAQAASDANPFDQFDAPTGAIAPSQDEITTRVQAMLADPKTTGKQIRDYYTSLGSQITDHDSAVFDQRDAYIKANGTVPKIGTQVAEGAAGAPNVVDNRPLSDARGMLDGAEHVVSNAAGGLGWLGNQIGIENDIGGATRDYFKSGQDAADVRGTRDGKLVGEIATTIPLAFLTPQVEGAGLAAGLGRAAIGAADGALQGGLTTDSTTPGDVGRDMAIGGVLGAGFGTAAHALGRLAATPTRAAAQGREVLDAADRLSRDGLAVRPLPGDTGGAAARGLSATADAGIVSNIPYSHGVETYLDSTQAVRDRAAASLSNGAPVRSIDHVAGDVQAGVGGLGHFEARSAELIGNQYEQAAQQAAGVQIQTPATRAALDRLIDQAERTPGGSPGLAALRALRDDLTPTPDQVIRPSLWRRMLGARDQVIPGDPAEYAIDSLRRLRTSHGDNYDVNQRSAREAARELWGPLSQDIQNGLRGAGRHDAADAYQAADTAWAQRQTHLDEVVNPILGSRNQGQLADHFVSLSRNDADMLDRALGLMAPDQAAQLRSALVGNLGRAKSGQQNAAGDAFSLNGFLTDWDQLADGVKTRLLSGQAGTDLQDLARLAEGARSAGRYRNTSNTARSADALARLKSAVSSGAAPGAGIVFGGVPGAAAALLGQYGLGRVMASPTIGRALVRAGEVRPGARALSALARIGKVSAPVVANGTTDNDE